MYRRVRSQREARQDSLSGHLILRLSQISKAMCVASLVPSLPVLVAEPSRLGLPLAGLSFFIASSLKNPFGESIGTLSLTYLDFGCMYLANVFSHCLISESHERTCVEAPPSLRHDHKSSSPRPLHYRSKTAQRLSQGS